MTRRAIERVFARLARAVADQVEGFAVVYGGVAPASRFPAARNYAFTLSTDPPQVFIAPRMLRADAATVVGVLAHEIAGHAALLYAGYDVHTERDADACAEKLLKIRISYRPPLYVQATDGGVRPRPAFLG